MAGPHAVVAPFISSQLLGTDLDILANAVCDSPSSLRRRSQTLAYRNISWVCHTCLLHLNEGLEASPD